MRARCIPSEGPSGQARQYGHKGATKHLSSVWHKERIYSYDGALGMDDVAGLQLPPPPWFIPDGVNGMPGQVDRSEADRQRGWLLLPW